LDEQGQKKLTRDLTNKLVDSYAGLRARYPRIDSGDALIAAFSFPSFCLLCYNTIIRS